MQISVYHPSQRPEWDDFVGKSKNGTFLFFRNYMDYRCGADDCSLMVRDDRGALITILPANHHGDRVISHGGLTYGGFVSGHEMTVSRMLAAFADVLTFLRRQGFATVIYKTVPHIYHRAPSEEDRYALFLLDAHLVRRDVLAVSPSWSDLPFQTRRRRGIKKAIRNGLTVSHSSAFNEFWPILTENLMQRHDRPPVHNLEEILLLHSRFPQNIKLFACFDHGMMLGGTVVYETDRVVHCQYTAASPAGKELGALDLLFKVLLREVYQDKPYFDFGISTESNGRYLNRGLNDQKEGFGARAIVHDHYELVLRECRQESLLAEQR